MLDLLVWEKWGVYKKYSGNVTSEEVLRGEEAVQNDTRFDDVRYIISDYMGATDTKPMDETTEYLAALRSVAFHSNKRILLAYVATNARLIAALNRYFSAYCPPYPYRLFSTVEEARNWVG